MIFISPVPLSEETLQYYSKLLGLKTAIDSGNVEDQGDFNERYKIIVPEAIKSFPVSNNKVSCYSLYIAFLDIQNNFGKYKFVEDA